MKKTSSRPFLLALMIVLIGTAFGGDYVHAQPVAKTEIGDSTKTSESGRNGAAFKVVYQTWHDAKRNRDIPVKLYIPAAQKAPLPVVVFSHGLGGSVEAAVYLGEYWAQHGYLGVFVQHPGSDSSVWKPAMGQGREAIYGKLREAANADNLILRIHDIKFTLDQLEIRNQDDPELKQRMNLSKIAVAGHSFGAGTALAIAGETFRQRQVNTSDKRVKSAIYLCPPVMLNGDTPENVYGSIQIPGMLLTGTEDVSPIGNTTAADRRIPFDGMKAKHQFLINFVGADHSVFGGRSFRSAREGDEKFHEMIQVLTTKFLDATLRDDDKAWHWLDSGDASAYLGKTATFEQK